MASTALSAAELEAQFANAKAYLMRADKDGVSAYDQLTRLMELLLEENPENVAGDPSKLHEILSFIQTHSFACGESTSACYEATQVPAEELRRFEDNKKLFDLPAPEVRTVIEQPDPYTTITTTTVVPLKAPSFESVAAQNKYWTAAGCGLADEEAFLLDRSITNLAMEKNLQDIKFFGKIFGTHSDYFVLRTRRYLEAGETVYVETNTMGKPPRKKGMVPVQAEPGYVGVNRYTFWVTASPSDKWEKLPDVTPQQINAARETKRFFTGDLSASRKPKEAKYKPLVVPSPDYGEEEVDVAQLTIDRWVHAEGYIYKNGRQTKPLRDDDVPDDDPTKMKIACWTMRVENNVSKAHRMAVVQSLRWPGATAYAAEGGKRWSCVYFGNGMKKTDAAFTPPPAPPVQSECADITEVEDPTATVEKLVRRGEEIPEADSEAEPDELEEEEDS
ncbi:Radial spokehead-like family protein [Leishmania donovani]|uniref:Radial spokehead-like family protein n=1 Tax=Leishmania donovani TaxID=5661 RepID=A0A504XP05_LEIDO|nr:Radial spokehead-like family protein [Leishmania donovani]